MKLNIILIFTAVIMAFATGYSLLFLRSPQMTVPNDQIEVSKIKRDFQKKVSSITVIDFSSYYPTEDHLKLLVPHDRISITSLRGKDQTDYSGPLNCFTQIFKHLSVKNYQKLMLWEEFRCGMRSELPANYFAYPPFVHPSGKSFAFLAYNSPFSQFHSPQWVKDYLYYFHVQELSQVKRLIGHLPGPFAVLEGFDRQLLQDLLTGRPQLLSRNYFLIKIQYIFASSLFKYKVFLREDLEEFLRRTPFEVTTFNPGDHCLIQDENLCWNYNARHFFKLAYNSSFYLFLGSMCLLCLVIWGLMNRIKAARLEEERRRLALQVLTHEFRTPVASMLLQRERISKLFDTMPEEVQEVFLRLSDDIYRLQRLVEKSRSYLKMGQHKGLIAFNLNFVPSVNEFFQELLIPYEQEGLHFHPLVEDREFSLDIYWVSICFNNLVENGLNHGKKPIDIHLRTSKSSGLELVVEDKGGCEFSRLDQMIEPFVKGGQSKGTGLGLNLVYKIITEMGGAFRFKQNPKRFILEFPAPRL